MCRKFQFASMNVSKVIAGRKLKKSLRLQNFKIFEIFNVIILKNQIFFPSKNHLSFLTIERYDIQLCAKNIGKIMQVKKKL